ncbi:ABC transporter permease [Klenkia taihuensis]|uniref:Ribose transport system permease protein n=1 Tax=Klenkia taihuensis TaxID=1225127 RepID=A0A1I1U1V3_9ACTN|nr:ABC transporter permease [Klenkia taihuensis]GHE06974.1 ribose ABC transporter permease [Klenkia taihuensis]SFD64846.1 ribose transport system permease protein [Klenkia taihuensis]
MNRLADVSRTYGLQGAILALVIVAVLVVAPDFVGQPAAFSVLERLVPLGIITAGIAVTMIVGELDLSIASVAALSGATAILLSNSGLGLVPVLLVATAAGAAVGALQGWAVARLGISSLVLTVGTLILFRGATSLVTGGVPITPDDYGVSDQLLMRYGVLSPTSITALLVLVVLGVFLSRTRPGMALYAVGGGRNEAVAAGVPLRPTLVIAFAISGGCGALAGALSSLRSASATPDGFTNMLLLGVAAALVGGISLAGGRGGMVNVLLGVVITSTLAAGLSSVGFKAFVAELFTGVLLLAVIGADAAVRWISRRRYLAEQRRQLSGLSAIDLTAAEPEVSRR